MFLFFCPHDSSSLIPDVERADTLSANLSQYVVYLQLNFLLSINFGDNKAFTLPKL